MGTPAEGVDRRRWKLLWRGWRHWSWRLHHGAGIDRDGYYWSTSWGPFMWRSYD